MRDLYHNVLATQVLAPVVSTAAKTSSTIDLQGFNSLSVVFDIGLSGDTLSSSLYWTLTLEDSPDGVTFTPVAAGAINADIASIVINAPSLDRTAYSLGYIGSQRYLQAVATPTGSVSLGVPIGIVALRGTPGYRPVVYP
ncbi:MAG: hypothetical protein KGI29_03960 [Pseudomonadota bacterium]|nr:hypothetical protein [Pseudomonadota bacterium]MDE3037141.1 hypothetical protein [Pseudomonadota bacterium]